MSEKVKKIIKILLLEDESQKDKIHLNYNITVNDILDLNNYFMLENNIYIDRAIYSSIKNNNNKVDKYIFKNYLNDIRNDINEMLKDY